MSVVTGQLLGHGASPDWPTPGKYRHFKGGEYELLAVGRSSETDEPVAIYRAAGEPDDLWVRPLEMFVSTVSVKRGEVPRFELVEPTNPRARALHEVVRLYQARAVWAAREIRSALRPTARD